MLRVSNHRTGEEPLGRAFLTRTLQRLVQTPSANPGEFEGAMAQLVEESLVGTGAEVTTVEFAPGRPSLVAVLKGRHPGPTLVLNGHMDTVPVEDEALWSFPTHEGAVAEGYVYGRGACDMKAGLAIEIALAHHFGGLGVEDLHGTLMLQFAAGEERGEPGTLALIEAGFKGDYGIVLEPTGLRVATATRGVARYRVRIVGSSGHASRPEFGKNPLWSLAPLLELVADLDTEARVVEHPLLPPGTCTPTMVRGGSSENSIPEWCELVIDRRLLPGDDPTHEAERLQQMMDERLELAPGGATGYEVSPLLLAAGAEVPSDGAFVQAVMRAVEEQFGSPVEPWGAPFGSDVRNLVNDAGMEAVTFGPGEITACHCVDERVAITDLEAAAAVVATVASEVLADP